MLHFIENSVEMPRTAIFVCLITMRVSLQAHCMKPECEKWQLLKTLDSWLSIKQFSSKVGNSVAFTKIYSFSVNKLSFGSVQAVSSILALAMSWWTQLEFLCFIIGLRNTLRVNKWLLILWRVQLFPQHVFLLLQAAFFFQKFTQA